MKNSGTPLNIMRATLDLLAESNPDTLSIDGVAKRAKISRGSVFWHFESKDGLLLACMDLIFREFVEKLQIDFEKCNSRAEKLRVFLTQYAEFCKKRPEINIVILSFMIQKRDHKKMRTKMQGLYAKFREYILVNLELADTRESRSFATFVIGALDGIFLQWLVDPEAVNLTESYLLIHHMFENYDNYDKEKK